MASGDLGFWLVQVSILVAILYLVLGILRLGFLCNMLSKPIISAFLTAGAIIISTSQVAQSRLPPFQSPILRRGGFSCADFNPCQTIRTEASTG